MTPRGPGRSQRRSGGVDVLRLRALLALDDVERHGLALLELTEARGVDRGVVREDVRTAAVLGDEAEALLRVEPLHSSSCHSHAFQSMKRLPRRGACGGDRPGPCG